MVQFFHVVRGSDLRRDFIPIGRPLPGVDAFLADGEGRRCGVGQVGEIWIGGSTLSLGYLRNDAATRAVFLDTELPDGRRAVAYRTGDLAVRHDDDTYQLLGRRDDQLKIRGVRVEPREVEDALTAYPLVLACAVKGVDRGGGETALVAYVVPQSQYPPAVPDMRAYLRERLPEQMIPARFVLLERLPLTETGKVDRQALTEPDGSPGEDRTDFVEPRNPLERALADHWSEILGVARVGVEDHFLDLGGHSLSAMLLISRVRSEMNVDLRISDVFEHPTIAALARCIEKRVTPPHAEPSRLIAATTQTPLGTERNPATLETVPVPVWSATAEFGCPTRPSPLLGTRRCNLVLVLGQYGDRDSFERLAQFIEQLDPEIRTALTADEPGWHVDLPTRPTLIFSPGLIRHAATIPGRVFCGYPLSKSEEYRLLEKAGIPVPRWVTLTEGETPDLEGFGEYVVRKPDYGAKGAEVRIVRRDRIRWRRVVTAAAGPSPTLIVQEFIYTGPWPISFRVNTLFGKALFALRLTGRTDRPRLRGPSDFGSIESGRSVSIVANARDSNAEFCYDPEIIRLGERAHRAFPDLPMLGVDVLKDAETGELSVVEVNAIGYNWNFSKEFQTEFGIDFETQFDGVRKAAHLLAEQTQKSATLSING
jgi:hypothetical protein